MIKGTVTGEWEAKIKIVVRSSSGQYREYNGIVDTGYTGWLTLPRDIIAELDLPWREWGAAVLADGSEILFSVFDAMTIWDGKPIEIPVDEADAEPLIGMRLMQGCRVLIEAIEGGSVQIERLE